MDESSKHKPKLLGDLIVPLINSGTRYSEIAKRLGCSKSTVTWWSKRIGHLRDARRYPIHDWAQIGEMYDSGKTAVECRNKFNFSPAAWYKAVRDGFIVLRAQHPFRTIDEMLSANPKVSRKDVKQRLKREGMARDNCELCGLSHWMGKQLSLHLHHKNGIPYDHEINNLEWVCPNCHSLTESYAGKNSSKAIRARRQAA